MIETRSLEEVKEFKGKLEELREEAKIEMERIAEKRGPMAAIDPDYIVAYTTIVTVDTSLETLEWVVGGDMEFSAILKTKILAEETKRKRGKNEEIEKNHSN